MKTYACATCPFFITSNSRGFTLILPLAAEGTAFPNSPSAPMTGRLRQVGFQAAGAAALIPSFAREGSGSSSRLFKAVQKGHVVQAQVIPEAGCRTLFHIWNRTKTGPSTAFNSGGKSPASIGGEFVTNLTQWRETSPHCYLS